MLFQQGFVLKEGNAHGNPQLFNFFRTSDNTAVVIGQNYNGFVDHLWIKNPFAGNIEVVAVNKGNELIIWLCG